MSLKRAEEYLENKGFLDHVIELEESTATVAMAAEALGVEPGMIAKTMSFLQGENAVLILTEGTARVDNRKYKDTFHVKAKMIPFDQVEEVIGHAIFTRAETPRGEIPSSTSGCSLVSSQRRIAYFSTLSVIRTEVR